MKDKSNKPSIEQISDFIGNPLFLTLNEHMETVYNALCNIEYSGDNVLPGWNVKYYKSGRTLCRIYPKDGYFTVLVVIGRKEKERAEVLLPQMSETVRGVYENTKEGMGQRWLVFDLHAPDAVYSDLLKLVEIRRKS